MKRHLARETAFQVIYQIDVGKNDVEQALLARLNESTLDEAGKKFCQQLVKGTINNLEKIDEMIEQYAVDWPISRMLSVDRNLLRLAVFEIIYCDDIPNKVAVNEAIELAKSFGSEDSAKFINGILGNLVKSLGE